jgi:hypothetical protein
MNEPVLKWSRFSRLMHFRVKSWDHPTPSGSSQYADNPSFVKELSAFMEPEGSLPYSHHWPLPWILSATSQHILAFRATRIHFKAMFLSYIQVPHAVFSFQASRTKLFHFPFVLHINPSHTFWFDHTDNITLCTSSHHADTSSFKCPTTF